MEASKMEVKIISSEIIKPSCPTPSHLRKLTLSLLDQKYAATVVAVMLFYGPPQGEALEIDIGRFKTCLSQTLTAFYPLAGRVESVGSILCNDEGVPFIEARVNCTLETLLDSLLSYNKNLASFYPPRAGLLEEGVQLSIQVNVFKCGGFCIGWYHTHKVTDGTSMGTFFRYWAALVAQRVTAEHAAQDLADFSSAVRVFPPVPVRQPQEDNKPVTPELNREKEKQGKKEEPKEWSSLLTRTGVRSFLIKNEAVEKLKAKSISDQVLNPSRFEAVAGFIWKSILLNSTKEGRSALSVAVDFRPRVDPPLPVGAMGNIFGSALVQSENTADLHELVARIRESVSKTKDLVIEYQGEKREEAKDGHRKKFIDVVIESMAKDVYIITAWCKSAGFRDVDFGFGNPKWVVPMDEFQNQRNMIILTEFGGPDGDGFEAWMFLEEDCIKFLESNSEFLAFATPNF
ncbi:hypothetical protein vseg_005680 [Gypsophila vaccaria]